MTTSRAWGWAALVLGVGLTTTAGCGDDDGTPQDDCAAQGTCAGGLRDLGAVPGATVARAIAIVGDDVLIGTDVGVFRRSLGGSEAWQATTLADVQVQSLRVHPERPELIVAGLVGGAALPIAVSTDGGLTWTMRGAEFLDPTTEAHDPAFDIVFAGGSRIYVSGAAGTIVESTDDGTTWAYVDGAPGFLGYACYLAKDGESLLQGCELPLDDAWIDRLAITEDGLGARTRIVGLEQISNRRPNALITSAHHPGVVWAGLEGGLIKISGSDWSWLHMRDGGDDYLYVRGVWVDPTDHRHLLLGGFKSPAALSLFETFDEGATLTRLAAPAGASAGTWDIEAFAVGGIGDDVVAMAVTAYELPDSGGASTARAFVRDAASSP